MKLNQKMLHMDRVACTTGTQIALEEDRNIPDHKPDIAYILAQRYQVRIEDTRQSENHVNVKGKLQYQVLYQSEERGKISVLEGEIPFAEQVNMDGVTPEQTLRVNWSLEDMTIGIINSRKLSVQAVICFTLTVEELYDELLPTGVEAEADVQIEEKYAELDIAGITTWKKDVFRLHETIDLPQNYPNIGTLLWHDYEWTDLHFKTATDKIFVKGELRAFFLYETPQDGMVYSYPVTIPVNASLECQGCQEYMIPDISYEITGESAEVHQDFDGEDRSISVELTLDLWMKLYEEVKQQILEDCYGITGPIQLHTKELAYKTMLIRHTGKCRIGESVKEEIIPDSCKVLYASGIVQKESEQLTEEGMEILGAVDADFILREEGGGGNFYRLKKSIPFHYILESPGLCAEGKCSMNIYLEQLQAARAGDAWELKAVLNFDVTASQRAQVSLIHEIDDQTEVEEGRRPGMIGLIAQEQDTLWELGKTYMVSQAALKELNHLEKEQVARGDKLLIMR